MAHAFFGAATAGRNVDIRRRQDKVSVLLSASFRSLCGASHNRLQHSPERNPFD
jgi:hypothetical protein